MVTNSYKSNFTKKRDIVKDLRKIHEKIQLTKFESFYRLSSDENKFIKNKVSIKAEKKFNQKNYFNISRASDDVSDVLPNELEDSIVEFANKSNTIGAFLIENLLLDQHLGPTGNLDLKMTSYSEIILIAIANLIGYPYGYFSQRKGLVIQNLFPKIKDQNKQLGTGRVYLDWHTEDAFHNLRCNHILLLCLRGTPEAYTLISKIDFYKLKPQTIEQLLMPNFIISSDEAHGVQKEVKVSILEFKKTLTLRYDPLYTTKFLTKKAETAFKELKLLIHESAIKIALKPGDLLIIDNDKAVHGRSLFPAKFDGHDRWLQRIVTLRSKVKMQFVKSTNPYIINL